VTIYVGVDAGTVSGLAIFDGKKLEMVEVASTDELVYLCSNLMMRGSPTKFFYEKFVISARTIKTTVVYDTLLFNGWLHHEGRRFKYIETQGYTAAQSKSFSTNDKLKHMGWYLPTKDGHANDAARVLLLGLASAGYQSVIERLATLD
jgi:hypothetical protein